MESSESKVKGTESVESLTYDADCPWVIQDYHELQQYGSTSITNSFFAFQEGEELTISTHYKKLFAYLGSDLNPSQRSRALTQQLAWYVSIDNHLQNNLHYSMESPVVMEKLMVIYDAHSMSPTLIRLFHSLIKTLSQNSNNEEIDEFLTIDRLIRDTVIMDKQNDTLKVSDSNEIQIETQNCCECGGINEMYCEDCEYCYCKNDYEKYHKKGSRALHRHILIHNCSVCHTVLAQQICSHCNEYYCAECFATKHVNEVPTDKEYPPQFYNQAESLGKVEEEKKFKATRKIEWFGFIDYRGIPFHYNFNTKEVIWS